MSFDSKDIDYQRVSKFCCIQNYAFARGFLWARTLVSDIKGETQTGGVGEQGAEENIWFEEG
jgi:hypothetical protein